VETILGQHRPESLDLIIAATFLICTSWKEGTRRKLATGERKKVIESFDERFTTKEVNEWIDIIEKDLEKLNWFENHPVMNVESRKRKAENDTRKVKLVKNISGVGIMV
jgi:hypothetical protein